MSMAAFLPANANGLLMTTGGCAGRLNCCAGNDLLFGLKVKSHSGRNSRNHFWISAHQ